MPLKEIGRNPPLTSAQKRHLVAITRSSKRSTREMIWFPCRPGTPPTEEGSLANKVVSSRIFDVLWPLDSATTFAALAASREAYFKAAILHALANNQEAAEDAYVAAVEHDDKKQYERRYGYVIRSMAAFAVGRYAPRPNDQNHDQSHRALLAVAPLVRFPSTRARLDGEAILATLPQIFQPEARFQRVEETFWAPAVRSLTTLREDDDDAVDKQLAAALKTMSVSPENYDEHDAKRFTLELLCEIALARGRMLAAIRISKEMKRYYHDDYLLHVAIRYVDARDFGGAYQLIDDMPGSALKYADLAKHLEQAGVAHAATND